MAAVNDITGDALISKTNSDAYRNNYDAIFGKKNVVLKDHKTTLTNYVDESEVTNADTNAGGAYSSHREE